MAQEPKFVKAPQYKGKHLSLHVSGASRTILDGVVLVGAQWEKFVKLGFLVPVADEPAPAPAAPPVPPAPPVKPVVEPVKAPESPVKAEVAHEASPASEAAPEPTVPVAAPKKSLDELLADSDTEEKPAESDDPVESVTKSTAGKMMAAASKRKRRSRKS